MLSVDEARAVVLAAARPLGSEEVAVTEALDRVLAEDVSAAHDVPAFANSAMDGFAVRAGAAGRRVTIVGESRAGAPAAIAVGDGEAVRISTGAALPDGADAVVPLERTTEEQGGVLLEGDSAPGDHVRDVGGDLRAGARVLVAGSRLGPAELGVAVGAGRAELRCSLVPRVAVVATGDELVAPGAALGPGQVHDANALTLVALTRRAGARVVSVAHAADDATATRDALAGALADADLLLVSGGVSVGPHDHVKPALEQLGVRESFWRVAVRPGKPTWFGTADSTLVLGLPGNPVSVMVTFLLFARAALAGLEGAAPPRRRRAVLADAVGRHADRDEAVRVRFDDDGRAHPTGPQGSHVLSSMLAAEALALVPRGLGELPPGTTVEVELI